jgi:hypothetical protein
LSDEEYANRLVAARSEQILADLTEQFARVLKHDRYLRRGLALNQSLRNDEAGIKSTVGPDDPVF